MMDEQNHQNELRHRHKQEQIDWEAEYKIPPRNRIHSSDREKLTKLFYRILFSLFFILTFTLLGWGLWTHQIFE